MKSFRVALFLLMFAFSVHAATLSGTVRDSEGAGIAKAHVVVHWDAAGTNYLGENVASKTTSLSPRTQTEDSLWNYRPGSVHGQVGFSTKSRSMAVGKFAKLHAQQLNAS
jgi:hypothetical protein